MGLRRASVDHLLEQPLSRGLVAIPLGLIVAITVVDLQVPEDVHLGPLLVIAPALTASLGGTAMTALAGVLAITAQMLIAVFHGGLTTPNHLAQIVALTLLSGLTVFLRHIQERRERALGLARSVAETAQRVLLRPPPRRVGPLRVAWLYLSAEDETQIGGDLFAVARADRPATRVIIGDVRGKGLAAIAEASLVLGAFREGAHRYDTLPELVGAVEDSVHRNLAEVVDTDQELGEHFITALMVDIPDDTAQAEMINFGHPAPLRVRGRQVTALSVRQPVPPLGVYEAAGPLRPAESFTVEGGDLLVLYTDGVVEARSPGGVFYPLAERITSFLPVSSPDALLRHIHHDLLRHVGGNPGDDVAVLVIERIRSRHFARTQPAAHLDGHPD
ncbi:PP2C family protein-serine/threonine phosphatase [Streptomyces sp. NPDC002265]|uniref:PP2C family protein-serine/threonine phosphatase n=1 Tax=Streptomyces sp. NPDC002265 TaxID=3154415 RepID=UPI003328C6DE